MSFLPPHPPPPKRRKHHTPVVASCRSLPVPWPPSRRATRFPRREKRGDGAERSSCKGTSHVAQAPCRARVPPDAAERGGGIEVAWGRRRARCVDGSAVNLESGEGWEDVSKAILQSGHLVHLSNPNPSWLKWDACLHRLHSCPIQSIALKPEVQFEGTELPLFPGRTASAVERIKGRTLRTSTEGSELFAWQCSVRVRV